VAYVGSSNLTNPALTHGIEWNYRVSSADNPSGFAEVSQAFTKLFVHPPLQSVARFCHFESVTMSSAYLISGSRAPVGMAHSLK